MTDRIFRSAPGRWTIWRCRRCGVGHPSPRPDEVTISRAYKSYDTHESNSAKWWMARRADGVRRLPLALINGRINTRLGYRRQPVAPVGDLLLPLMVRRDRELLAHLMHVRARPGGRLLDVGCGSGDYLKFMRSLGWTPIGIDPDPAAVETARGAGLDVHLGTVQAAQLPAGSFSAITLNHSIEHVHDPVALLRECRRLLASDGELVVFTPNLESEGHRRFGRDWFHLDPPRHLVIFTPSSLTLALIAAGFAVVEQLPPRLRGASMRASMALRARQDLLQPTRLPMRLRRAAGLSNLRVFLDPTRAEEVALRAKP